MNTRESFYKNFYKGQTFIVVPHLTITI